MEPFSTIYDMFHSIILLKMLVFGHFNLVYILCLFFASVFLFII